MVVQRQGWKSYQPPYLPSDVSVQLVSPVFHRDSVVGVSSVVLVVVP